MHLLPLKINTSIDKNHLKKFESKKSESKYFPWFPGFFFEIYTKKQKLRNLKNCLKNVRIWSYSVPHFPPFGLYTERYSVSLRIKPECRKMRTGITTNTGTFYAVQNSTWEYVFKITWNAVKMTSKSKWLSHIANHVEGSCLVKGFDPCRFIKLSPLFLISVFTLGNLRSLSKNESQTHLNSIAQNPKNLYDFQIFVLRSIPLNENSKIMEIILKYNVIILRYLNIASKSFTA